MLTPLRPLLLVVIGLSKIMIMKAIHNSNSPVYYVTKVVIGLSKIMIMKAIHNYMRWVDNVKKL